MTKLREKSKEQEEFQRFVVASERLVKSAQADKKVAEDFLREIGYYEVMAIAKAEREDSESQSALTAHAKTPVAKTTRSKTLTRKKSLPQKKLAVNNKAAHT